MPLIKSLTVTTGTSTDVRNNDHCQDKSMTLGGVAILLSEMGKINIHPPALSIHSGCSGGAVAFCLRRSWLSALVGSGGAVVGSCRRRSVLSPWRPALVGSGGAALSVSCRRRSVLSPWRPALVGRGGAALSVGCLRRSMLSRLLLV